MTIYFANFNYFCQKHRSLDYKDDNGMHHKNLNLLEVHERLSESIKLISRLLLLPFMILDPIDEGEFDNFLRCAGYNEQFLIILIDGTSLFCPLPKIISYNEMQEILDERIENLSRHFDVYSFAKSSIEHINIAKENLSHSSHICILFNTGNDVSSRSVYVYISFEKIAWINSFVFEQNIEGKKFVVDDASRNPAHIVAYKHTLDKISKLDISVFRLGIVGVKLAYPDEEPFIISYGDIILNNNTPLYSDWSYLQYISGGLTSLGIGTPLGGLEFGWSESLWKIFMKKVKGDPSSFNEIRARNDVVLKGFLSFINHKYILHSDEFYDVLQMEGETWIAAALSDKKVRTSDELKRADWSLIYFKEKNLMLPIKLLEKIADPVVIFAEIIPACIKTQAGNRDYFLKARCAAYIK